jgi:hypothetical protein
MTKKLLLFFAALFILFQLKSVYADIVKLIEGSVLVGKIISEDKETVIFTNAYGTFKINRKNIIEIYKTTNFAEDIEILKKLKMGINAEVIKMNIDAGKEKKDKLQKDPSANNLLTIGRICLSGSFNYVTGKVNEKLPYGYSGHIAFDQGLDKIPGKRYAVMPALRFEAGYNYFSHGTYKISGYSVGMGPIWEMPYLENSNGCLIFAVIPGISFLEIENSNATNSVRSNTFTGSGILGYLLTKGDFSIFLQIRYMYIYDKSVSMHTIGGEIGFSYNLW